MKVYAYRCRDCGYRAVSEHRGDFLKYCPDCSTGRVTRDYSGISLHRPIMPHFNPTLQREVTGMSDFTEGLKRAGAAQEEATGVATRYVPVMPQDVPVTSEGLDTTNRARVARGQRPVEVP